MRAIRYQSNRNVDYCCKYHFVWCPNTGVKCEVEQIGQRLKHKLPTLWINRYFVATVGRAPLAVIKPYLENQKHV